MTGFTTSLDEYLRVRRSVGYQLKLAGWLLGDFVSFLEQHAATTITTELSLRWATAPVDASPAWWAQRLSAVRGFARYLSIIDPATEVPPAHLLSYRTRRARPYLYSAADVEALMGAAHSLTPRLRAATYETLFGLLAVTGMRVGEAIALDRADVVMNQGLVRVTHAKLDKFRDVPLHDSSLDALNAYLRCRDELSPAPNETSFFVSAAGRRLSYSMVQDTFATARTAAGLTGEAGRHPPRLHDLRHSFAVASLIDFYHSGQDVAPLLPRLSTFLGHVDPKSTYWYLQAAPALLDAAAERLGTFLTEQS